MPQPQDRTIGELPEAETFQGGEMIPVTQGGATRKAIAGTHLAYLVNGELPAEVFPAGFLNPENLVDTLIGNEKFGKLVKAVWDALAARAEGGIAGALNAVPARGDEITPTETDPYPISIVWDRAKRLLAETAEIRGGAAGNLVATVARAEEAAAPGAALTLNGTVTLDLLDGPNRQISLTGNSTLNLFSNLRTHPGGYISGVTAGAFSLTIGAAAGVTVVPLNVLTPPQTANDRWAYAWLAPTPNLVLIGKCGEAAL